MERKMTQQLTIVPGLCDSTARLGVPDAFRLFMDIAGEHAETIGVGAAAMQARRLFWLTVRTMIRFHRRPVLAEHAALATFPGIPGKARCMRYYTLTQGEALLCEGKTEWAVLETGTGRLHPMQGVYPEELELTDETVCDGAFSRIQEDFSGDELLETYRVRSTDIDLGGHMNNAAYIRMLFGALPTSRLHALHIREAEACFRAPCFENDLLTLRCRETAAGLELGAIRQDGKTAMLLALRTEENA